MGHYRTYPGYKMMRAVILLVGLAQVSWVLGDCGQTPLSPITTGFIVGGYEARPHSLPWQISLQGEFFGFDMGHFCGGTIISDRYVLTAAHCLGRNMKYKVVVGAHSLRTTDTYQKTIYVDEVIIHEGYNSNDITKNDIALLKLSESIQYSDGVQPACLPAKTQEYDDDTYFTVSGWGTLSAGGAMPDKLQQVEVPHFDRVDCNNLLASRGSIPETALCAGYPEGGKDSCQGDSGGPLVTLIDGDWTVAGVVSWGIGCASKNRPGVYTNVAKYIDWIEDNSN